MNQPGSVPGTPKEIFHSIRIISGAIITGAIIFAVIVFTFKPQSSAKNDGNIFFIVAVSIAVICLAIAWTGYNKGIVTAKNPLISLTGKLNQYRFTLIRYLALCDGPALLGIILFFINGDYLSLIITAVMIAAMIVKIPTRKRVIDELGLDWQQQEELE